MAVERKQKESPKNVLPKPGFQKKELVKRKTPFSNTFVNPDGTFSTEVSSTPINYKNKSGNWRSVDNRLITKSEGDYDYENAANAFRVKFARNNFDGRLVLIELDLDRWIAFTPIDRFTQTGTIKDNSIFYKGIRTGVDLEYIVDGNSVKERIILNSPSSNIFRFEISYQGIRLEKDGEGIIWAVDAITGSRLMYFQKAYAEDSNGQITQNISTEIITEAGKEILVLTIDNAWIASAAFPVIIDPTLVVSIELADPSNIQDAYISGGYPNNYYYTNNYLHVGYLAGYNFIRSLIKFNYLPSLPLGAKIISASLNMFMYLGSTSGTTVDVFAITSPWDVTQTNWTNQPQTGSAVLTGFSATPNTLWNMNMTSLVTDWYQGNLANNGVMLKATNESSPKISFYSANEPTNTKPKLVINYEIDALGMDPYFTFHDNVNVHNGNLVLSDVDVELTGRGVPINVSRVYNLRSDATTVLGYRWRLDVFWRLKFVNTDMVYYTDADGSTMTFTKGPDGSYRSPVGLQDNLYYQNGVFFIVEKSGLRHYFNSTGKLDRITDTNNNSTVFTYLADGNIDKITDVAGRQVTFGYSGGKLTSITGSSIATVEYTYTGNNLTGMKKKDASGNILNEELYGYDVWNNLITITDALGNTTNLTYSYTDDLGRRVFKVDQKLTIDGILENLTTTYTYLVGINGVTTTVTNPVNRITEYTTNKMGNLEQLIEDKGGLNITTRYKWDEQQNLVESIEPKGEATLDPDSYRTVMDYDENGDIKRVVNPQNYSTTYDYELESEPKEIVDFGKKPNINNYDKNTRNLLSTSDPLFSTTVMQYDAYGNIISQTNPIGIGDNRIINSGFETWSGGLPAGWTVHALGGSINDDVTQKVNGDHSIRLESPGDQVNQQTIILSDFIEIKELIRYNVSWYVKTLNVQPEYGNATADIHWYTNNTPESWMGSQVNSINTAPTKGTTDIFIRKGTQVSSPPNARYVRIALGLAGGPNNSPATAWFDNVQFEMGSVINQYNLVHNADFELDMDVNNFPDGWNGANLTSLDVLDTTVTRTGQGRSLKIVGSAAAKSFSQEISFIGTVNTPIRLSGWAKATGWSVSGGTYRMKLEFYNETTLIGFHTADFPKVDTNWHLVDKVVFANNDFTMVKVYGMYENQTGTAWFDDFVVRLAEAPNAIMSAYNITQNGNFEVQDGQTNWPDEWTAFHGPTQGTYDTTWVKTNELVTAYSGDYMIKIANVPDWATVDNKIKEPIKTGKTYTASAVIKTNNVIGSGAVLKFNILDSGGYYLNQKLSQVITGTQDWTRVVVTLSEAEAKAIHANAARFRVAIGTIGATSGEMYFDAVRVVEGDITSKYTYDTNGNYITAVRDQMGNSITMVNDNRGNATQITDAKNNITKYIYDKLDNLKQVENSRELISAYFYDKESNLTQIDNHQRTGPTTSAYLNTAIAIQYNEQLLPKRITDGNWRATDFEYNKKMLLKDVKQPNGKQIHYLYDENDRPQSVTYTGDTTQWSFGYDPNSNMTSAVKNGTETTSFEYDNLDRATKVTFPAVFGARDNIQYTYNPNSKIVSSQYSKLPAISQQVIYEFDQADNNMIITGPNNTSAEFMYDEESRLKKSDIRINDVMKYNTYNDYDTAGRIIGMRTEDKSGAPVLDWSYFYDANNNRIKDVNNIAKKRIEYSYDTINQLIEERYYDNLATEVANKRIIYQYDLIGNRTQKSVITGTTVTTNYSYNVANEITNVNGTPQYTHDFNGNMTSAFGYTYTYNAENQLIRIDLSGAEVARYEYDSNGLRTRKITPVRTERYYYDNGELAYVTEENAGTSQNKLKYFFTRDTIGRLMHMVDYTVATPKTYCYILDVHGNVVALADELGNRVVNYEYDAWGNLTNTSEAVTTGNGEYLRNANPFRYSSYQFDTESGLYYLKARYYTATLGRFLTRDDHKGNESKQLELNQYAYCTNNPVNLIDANGLYSVAIASFVGKYGMGLSGVALAARLTTFVLAAAPYLLGGVAVVVALAVIAYGAYVIAQKVTIKNIIKKIPSKLKSGDKVNLSKFTGDGPKPPKGGRAWFGPLGWYIVKDIDKHKGVWKLFDWAGKRIATLAADGTVLGK